MPFQAQGKLLWNGVNRPRVWLERPRGHFTKREVGQCPTGSLHPIIPAFQTAPWR